MIRAVQTSLFLAVCLPGMIAATAGRCEGGAYDTKTVNVTDSKKNVFAVFEVKEAKRLKVIIESDRTIARTEAVTYETIPWEFVPDESTAKKHVWRTKRPVPPHERHYVRIQGWWGPPKRPGAPPLERLPDWHANVPQCDLHVNGLAEAEEESPGLVIAKAPVPPEPPTTINIIAGPTSENVGATVTLVPPKRNDRVIVRVNGTPTITPVTIADPKTATLDVQSANDKTGTERIELTYEVSDEGVYLTDTLAVTVVGDELQIVPEINCLCVGNQFTLWAYRSTTKVNADWRITAGGTKATIVGAGVGGWKSSEESVVVEGVQTSAVFDDVTVYARDSSTSPQPEPDDDTTDEDEERFTVMAIEQTPDRLWWFNDEDPENYAIQATLTVQGVAGGTFQWDVLEGRYRVDLNNNGEDSDSIGPVENDNTVVVKSTNPSVGEDDVVIQLTYTNFGGHTVVCRFRTTVFAPDSLHHISTNDALTGGPTFTSYIRYEVRDQFDVILPHRVPYNEDTDGNGQFSNAATVSGAAKSDWTILNGRPEDENWEWGDEGGRPNANPAFITDFIGRPAGPTIHPSPQYNPPNQLGNDKIDHSPKAPKGGWYIGSATPGLGVKVMSCYWQIYRDHARHEGRVPQP